MRQGVVCNWCVRVCVCVQLLCVGGRVRWLLVAVNLCSVSVVCVCVHWFESYIGLCRLLVAVSLHSVSVVCVYIVC